MKNKLEKSEAISDFLHAKSFAIVGVSRNKNKFSNSAFMELVKKEWKIFPVNPAMDTIEGIKCYPTLAEIPEKVEAVISMVPKDKTLEIIRQAVDLNIKLYWLQQKTETPEAVELCNENNIKCVTGECILMFADPVVSAHKFHRWINKIFGKYPM